LAKAFTFICGEDDFLVSNEGKRIFLEMTEGVEDDLSKEVIDGRAGKADEVVQVVTSFISAAQTMSLFGDKKTVWLKDVSFLGDGKLASAKDTLAEIDRLKGFLETADPDSVNLLITASPIDRRRAFLKWVQKNSEFQFIEGGNANDLAVHIRRELDPMGAEISHEALQLLTQKVAGNARLGVSEAVKLATYAREGDAAKIEGHHVREMVPDPMEGDFFESTDHFFSGDLQATLASLDRYFFHNSEARPLLASFQSRNRVLIQARTLLDGGEIRLGYRGIDKGELGAAGAKYLQFYGGSTAKSGLNVFTQNPWYLGKIAQQAERLKLRQLVDFQVEFVSAFLGLVDKPNDHHEVMRDLVVKCLG
jgi:DNA polymerase-3 subunit delta